MSPAPLTAHQWDDPFHRAQIHAAADVIFQLAARRHFRGKPMKLHEALKELEGLTAHAAFRHRLIGLNAAEEANAVTPLYRFAEVV